MITFNAEEFNQRWLKARTSALRKVCEPSKDTIEFSEADLIDQYFSQVAAATPEERIKKKDQLLRHVFDHSRLLAMSLSKFLGVTFEIQDFQDLLEKSEIPCVQGQWDSRRTAKVLNRHGCDFCPKSGANACDYWREALDGLVMGLGDKERLARHASVRHGDAACVDVFYFDAEEERRETSLAWGPIPESMTAKLLEICDDFESKMKTSILLKGLREGVLYFEFKSSTDTLCSGGQLLASTFQRKIQKHYPALRIQEVTPRAVLGVEQ
ncbi:MAG TPA: hypothetical protein VIG33_06945 [Pseudobdellovibrionaceae bacterium]|jgi:hypothetical protein